jgi:hypothetical protein
MVSEEEAKQAIQMGLEPEVVFNTLSDLRVFGVKDEDTGESIFEMVGYGLQVKFNRDKLKSVEDVENLLDGIKDLFRQMIVGDLIGPENSNSEAQE